LGTVLDEIQKTLFPTAYSYTKTKQPKGEKTIMQTKGRNRLSRVLAVLIMLTLVSTSLLGGTLARYVTTGSGMDHARVAKWGVVITAEDALGLFGSEYETHDTVARTFIGARSVIGTDGANVVAPGTYGNAGTLRITGTPEVAAAIKIKVDQAASQITGWNVDGYTYEPILWSWQLPGAERVVDRTFAELRLALADATFYVPAGVNLETAFDNAGYAIDISWRWPFEITGTPAEIALANTRDTALGNAAVPATITLVYSVEVTQVD
jgi:hypothetical protein